MGMDIYFQAFDKTGAKLGERQELRCRDIYHSVNRWCEARKQPSPESGEHVGFDATLWAEIAPKVRDSIAEADHALAGTPKDEALALGNEWLQRIWPPGAERVEYWFTV